MPNNNEGMAATTLSKTFIVVYKKEKFPSKDREARHNRDKKEKRKKERTKIEPKEEKKRKEKREKRERKAFPSGAVPSRFNSPLSCCDSGQK